MAFKHLVDLNDYSRANWDEIIDLAINIKQNPEKYYGACSGKILATLFYEPSTRTQMSFQTAMLRLGGSTIGFDNPNNSSVSKGENLKDTIKVVSGYADVMVIRHNKEGAAKASAIFADCPVINGGDGGHLHPTQTLTDLVTLKIEKNRLDNLVIGLCGDLFHGRTVHSLVKALSCFENNRFVFISTNELKMPDYIKEIASKNNCEFKEVSSLEECIDELDVLYMTRIQKERFKSEDEYARQRNVFILDQQKLSKAKTDLSVLHPLPRVDEIDLAVDDDHRAIYFKQAMYGVYARMSLILFMLKEKTSDAVLKGEIINNRICENINCITCNEEYLPNSFEKTGEKIICEFCEH